MSLKISVVFGMTGKMMEIENKLLPYDPLNTAQEKSSNQRTPTLRVLALRFAKCNPECRKDNIMLGRGTRINNNAWMTTKLYWVVKIFNYRMRQRIRSNYFKLKYTSINESFRCFSLKLG